MWRGVSIKEFCEPTMPVYMFDRDGNFQVLTVEQVSVYFLLVLCCCWHPPISAPISGVFLGGNGLGCYLPTSRLLQRWWC
jgi:hypothetical protein